MIEQDDRGRSTALVEVSTWFFGRLLEDVAAGGRVSCRLYQRETSLEMRQVLIAGPTPRGEAPTDEVRNRPTLRHDIEERRHRTGVRASRQDQRISMVEAVG
jgi:hypothetical protein